MHVVEYVFYFVSFFLNIVVLLGGHQVVVVVAWIDLCFLVFHI
jgi:hypothetical protein